MKLRLKEILAQRHITLKDFAISSGLSQSNLSNYLNGNISPTLDTLNRIAENLGIDITELFKEKDSVELFVKHNGILYPITKDDIIEIITNKAK
ncbi:MAG: helix-turn-helix transcriptional regulator [Bacteroidales bacterium]|nr:helix-turn-helix transcriptional regulator [Bacteroidales bacterium]